MTGIWAELLFAVKALYTPRIYVFHEPHLLGR